MSHYIRELCVCILRMYLLARFDTRFQYELRQQATYTGYFVKNPKRWTNISNVPVRLESDMRTLKSYVFHI